MRKKVDFVIPNYNGEEIIANCLEKISKALEANEFRESEIIVVDDRSKDNSIGIIRQQFPGVKIISNRFTFGFSRSANQGIKESNNEIVILLNNDCLVDKNFLSPLLEHFTREEIFAVSCKIIDWDGQGLRDGGKIGIFRYGFFSCTKNYEPVQLEGAEKEFTSFYASGAAMALERKKFLELEGFDEIYSPFYSEDTDLSYRAWKRGWKVLYEPKSIVYHRPGTTIKKFHRGSYIKLISKRNRNLFVWNNLSDPWLLAEHLFSLAVRLLLWIIGLRIWDIGGLILAFLKVPSVIKRRKKMKVWQRISDRELIKRANSYFTANQDKVERIW